MMVQHRPPRAPRSDAAPVHNEIQHQGPTQVRHEDPTEVLDQGPSEVVDRDLGEVADEFLTVVCSDPELLRAEFDALIANAWRGPVPIWPGRGPSTPARRPAPVSAWRGLRAGRSRPEVSGWARQRAPPTQPPDFGFVGHLVRGPRRTGRW